VQNNFGYKEVAYVHIRYLGEKEMHNVHVLFAKEQKHESPTPFGDQGKPTKPNRRWNRCVQS
jgi:hypothetical protein